MAALTCYEDHNVQVHPFLYLLVPFAVEWCVKMGVFVLQNKYRIMVEILNENDNSPVFVNTTVQPLIISEVGTHSACLPRIHTDTHADKKHTDFSP